MKFLKVKFAFFFLILQVITAGYIEDELDDYDDSLVYRSGYSKKRSWDRGDFENRGSRKKLKQQNDYYDDYSDDYGGYFEESGQGGSCNKCGQASGEPPSGSRVINGRPVQPTHKYPWIVALSRNGKIFCGGALVSATHIITAGHCVFNKQQLANGQCRGNRMGRNCYQNPHSIRVRLAGAREQDPSSLLAVSQIKGHPSYSFTKQMNDFAILQLAQPVRCSQQVMPVCLPSSDSLRFGTQLITAGYGFNTPEGTVGPQILREGGMKVIPPRRCASKPNEQSPNHLKTIVCAAGLDSGQSSCFGDSGSALFGLFGNKYYAVGVVSKGKSPRCGPQNPVTYTKTFAALRFIQQTVRDLPQGGQSI